MKPLKLLMILSLGTTLTVISTNNAYGDPPRGTPCVIGDEEFRCFDVEQYKGLLRAYATVAELTTKNKLLEEKSKELDSQLNHATQTRAVLDTTVALLRDDNERLLAMWKDENKRRHEAESKPGVGPPWVAWV